MKQLFILISVIGFTSLFAQEITVSSTDEFTNNLPNSYWTRVLGQDETGYYLLRESGPVSNRIAVLEKYSPAMKLLFATNIEATSGTFNDSKLHRQTEMVNGKIYVFLEGWNKAQQQNSYLVKEVLEDGTLAEGFTVLETEPSTGQMKSADYSISFSPDGSKLLVLTEKPFVKDGKETLRLQVFETDTWSSVWKQDLTLESASEKYPTNSIILDNAGIAYLFKDIKITNKEHIYQLITTGKDFSKTAVIDLKTYFPSQEKMMIDATGKMMICGLLSPQGKRATDWQAIWYLQADATGQIVENRTEPLGADLLKMLVSEKNAIQPGYALENFVLKDVLLKPKGGFILLTEEQRESKTAIGQTSPPTYQYDVFHGNVLAISFDQNGNRLWTSMIEKKQSERTMDTKIQFGSFAYQLKNDHLYVVWNFMDLHSDPPLNKYRYWFDRSGSKINIDNLFGREAYYPTLLTVINPDGSFQYAERTFSALPLEQIQKPNAFPMAVDPSMFFITEKGMTILSHMPGIESKRYKFNYIGY